MSFRVYYHTKFKAMLVSDTNIAPVLSSRFLLLILWIMKCVVRSFSSTIIFLMCFMEIALLAIRAHTKYVYTQTDICTETETHRQDDNVCRSITQGVNRWPLTPEARDLSQVSPSCGTCDGRSSTGGGLSPSTSIFPVSIIPSPCSLLQSSITNNVFFPWRDSP
jgi:hypothetical protein